MESTPTAPAARRPGRIPLSPTAAVLLAVSFGLCGGYLDLGLIAFKRLCLNPEGSFRSPRDFPWTVPASHAILLIIPGVVGGRRESAPAEGLLAGRRVVAVRDARDLVGTAQDADLRRLQPAPGRGAGPADQRRDRRPAAWARGRCDRSRRRRSAC